VRRFSSTNVKTGIFITSLQKRFGRGLITNVRSLFVFYRGVAQGVSTLHLSQELVIDRKHLLKRRHKLQNFVDEASIRIPLPDTVTEVDEMYQNAGEKGVKHSDPNDPPRCRGNKTRGMVRGILIALRFWVSLVGKVVKFNWKLNTIVHTIVREKTLNPLYSRPRNQGNDQYR